MLVDLRSFDEDLSGKKARLALDRAGISLNENTVPDDPRPPYITSGLRIGTPAVTTQGMGKREIREIAYEIHEVLTHREDEGALAEIRERVSALARKFAPYPQGGVTTAAPGSGPCLTAAPRAGDDGHPMTASPGDR